MVSACGELHPGMSTTAGRRSGDCAHSDRTRWADPGLRRRGRGLVRKGDAAHDRPAECRARCPGAVSPGGWGAERAVANPGPGEGDAPRASAREDATTRPAAAPVELDTERKVVVRSSRSPTNYPSGFDSVERMAVGLLDGTLPRGYELDGGWPITPPESGDVAGCTG